MPSSHSQINGDVWNDMSPERNVRQMLLEKIGEFNVNNIETKRKKDKVMSSKIAKKKTIKQQTISTFLPDV